MAEGVRTDRRHRKCLRATQNPEDIRAIEDLKAVSADRYEEIVGAAQPDVELKEKIVALLEEKREERGNQGGNFYF